MPTFTKRCIKKDQQGGQLRREEKREGRSRHESLNLSEARGKANHFYLTARLMKRVNQ